jgi:plastocyanin
MSKRLIGGLAGSLILILALASTTLGASQARRVTMLDDCDAATFNAVIGPGTCVKDGDVTFQDFIGQLIGSGEAPAWRFAPERIQLGAGGSVDAYNRGGEFHTFTEVAAFGGGCVAVLNSILGLTPVPECAIPGILGSTGVAPGDELEGAPLGAGTHLFECLIHPWMRATVAVD